MAPYKPALGPNPEETPKAKASGNATTPAVMPPKASPFMFEKNCFIVIELNKIKIYKEKRFACVDVEYILQKPWRW